VSYVYGYLAIGVIAFFCMSYELRGERTVGQLSISIIVGILWPLFFLAIVFEFFKETFG